jgi:hypothetical protein
VVEHLAGFIVDAVSKVKPFDVAKGRHPGIWPTTPNDLIPYGPETSIESLVTWSRFMGRASVFYLRSYLACICGPIMTPGLVASQSAPKYMIEHGL